MCRNRLALQESIQRLRITCNSCPPGCLLLVYGNEQPHELLSRYFHGHCSYSGNTHEPQTMLAHPDYSGLHPNLQICAIRYKLAIGC